MPTDQLANMLNTLESPAQVRDVLEEAKLLTDPLGVTLLRELAKAHSPIFVSDLPVGKASKNLEMVALYRMEKGGFVTSAMTKRGNSLVRKFHITDLGRKVADASG